MTNFKNTKYKNERTIIFLTLLLITLFFNSMYSQKLKISLGSGYQYHLEGTKSHGYILPFFDRHSIPTNSINEFFESSINYNLGISYKFGNEIASNLFIGLDFETSNLSSKFDEVDIVLGKHLSVNLISPYVGFGKALNLNRTVNLIWTLGLAVTITKGEAEKNEVKFIHNYEPEIFIRLGLIFEFELSQNFGIVFGMKGFIGNQTRDIVDVKYNEDSTYLIPSGSSKLQDNMISLFLNVQYGIVL